MKYSIIIIASLFLLNSCNVNRSELIGVYNSPNLRNNTDTLILYPDGKYERRLYKKSDKTLIISQSDHWKYDGEYFQLNNFFHDLDGVYSKDRKFNSSLMNVLVFVEKRFGTIEIDYSEFDKKYFYRKIN